MGILVLGMHRSGTSAVARLLNLMGCALGEPESLAQPAPDNPRGFWERLDVRRANDRLLAAQGKSWTDCLDWDAERLVKSETRTFEWTVSKILSELSGSTAWAIKDPRLSLVLDAWRPHLEDPVCVIVHRSPAACARSLSERNGIRPALGLALWEQYNLSALHASRNLRRTTVSYEDLVADPEGVSAGLIDELTRLGCKGLTPADEGDVTDFIDRDLDHQSTPPAEGLEIATSVEQDSLAAWLQSTPLQDPLVPQLSPASREILESASQQWPGQNWITRLLHERDAQIAKLERQGPAGTEPTASTPDEVPPARSSGVFVLGSPRSGTSVLSWTLAAHPQFTTSAESDYLLDLFGRGHMHSAYKLAIERPDIGWLRKEGVSYPEFAGFLGRGLEGLYDSRSGGKRWVDATPGYTAMADDLFLLFPAAQFLHILRDGRAVVSSMSKSGFATDWASDFRMACSTWAHYALSGRRAAEDHPERVLEVRYEHLTAEPERELGRIFSFLQEKPSDTAVELISTRRINSSYGNLQKSDIRKAKDPKSAPKRPWAEWTSRERRIFDDEAGDAMQSLGYPTDG